jgi:hypothetical protein
VLTDGRRVSVINAPAGSGKTHVLAGIAKAWTDARPGPVIGVTASQSARNTLAVGVRVRAQVRVAAGPAGARVGGGTRGSFLSPWRTPRRATTLDRQP